MDYEIARWGAIDEETVAPLEALEVLLFSGGKRLRPAFCHWGYVGAGGDPDDPAVVDAGAAFEMLHAFALAHDDVMDGSPTRRGRKATHVVFAHRHRANEWIGEARRFGDAVAILVGDLAFVYADELMRGAPAAARAVWDELRIELNIGQFLDVIGTARRERERSGALRIARYKSGKYTVERPLHVGAALAGAGRDSVLFEALSAYGLPLGDAFQLRDDVLGVFGDETLTGKPVGEDLREGKPTSLLAIASARADPQSKALLARIGATELARGEIDAIQRVVIATGARAELEDEIDTLVSRAIESLDRAPVTDEARCALADLARYVARRDS